jgi:cobalt-zinc-cadmium efflux system outer membrane protein
MIRTANLAGVIALLAGPSVHAADSVPTIPPAHAEFAPDGSVSGVHDGQYLKLALPQRSWTVEESEAAEQTLTWPLFIHEVLAANLDYAAARYNVDMAVADAAAAKLLPNPTLSLSGDRDLTFHNKYGTGSDGKPALLRQVESRSVGIDQTIEWWGKRKWRIKVADQALRAAAATLEDFLRNLKLDAAAAYADALAAQRVVDQLRGATHFLDKLNTTQQIRYAAGDISRPDLLETQVEQQEFLNDLSRAEDDAETARFALSTFLGRNRGRTGFIVTGDLKQPARDYRVENMIQEALTQRADLIALRYNRDAAESGVDLAKASRIPDVDVGVNYAFNAGVAGNHPIDPTPGDHQLTLNFAVPLPLFDRGQYAISKAKAVAHQSRVQLATAELHAEVDIRTAYALYQSAVKRVAAFDNGILKNADDLLEARRYGYQRGANTLLELIDAQRSDNQIRQDDDQAQAELAKAQIQLERVSGFELAITF